MMRTPTVAMMFAAMMTIAGGAFGQPQNPNPVAAAAPASATPAKNGSQIWDLTKQIMRPIATATMRMLRSSPIATDNPPVRDVIASGAAPAESAAATNGRGTDLSAHSNDSKGSSTLPIVTTSIGVAGVATGLGVLFGKCRGIADETRDAQTQDEQAGLDRYNAKLSELKSCETTAVAITAGGAAIALSGAIWWAMSGDSSPETATVGVSPNGLVIGGRF